MAARRWAGSGEPGESAQVRSRARTLDGGRDDARARGSPNHAGKERAARLPGAAKRGMPRRRNTETTAPTSNPRVSLQKEKKIK